MKSGALGRNIAVSILYFFALPFAIAFLLVFLPIVVGMIVGTNYRGAADRLTALPGVSKGGGLKAGFVAGIYGLVIWGLFSAAGGDNPSGDVSTIEADDVDDLEGTTTEAEDTDDEQAEADPNDKAEEDDSEVEEVDTSTESEGSEDRTDTEAEPAKEAENEEVDAPSYQIVEKGDMSYANVVRLEFNVVTDAHPDDLSDEELLALAEEIVDETTDEQAVNAIVIHIWDDPNDVGWTGNDAKVEWAPYGEWADGGEVTTGDYSEHEYIIDRP